MTPSEAIITVLFALAVPILMVLWALSSALFNWLVNNIASLFVKGKYQK